MKKLLGLFIVTLMGILMLSGLFVGIAQAKQDNDAWTKVHADWPNQHGYYKVSPNGVVHEKWSCDSNWLNCDGSATYYPTSKFANPPLNTACGASIIEITWEATDEYNDDEGDVSNFLIIGETYWFCDTFGAAVFRSSE